MEAELVTSHVPGGCCSSFPGPRIPSMGTSHGVCGQASREPGWPQRGAHGCWCRGEVGGRGSLSQPGARAFSWAPWLGE